MYVVRKQVRNNPKGVAFKTFDGWVYYQGKPKEALELGDVMRFTKGEAENNTLPNGEEFVWFGCYASLKR